MKENIQFVIAAILLSTGIVLIPCDARTNILLKTSGIRQAANLQEQQHGEYSARRLHWITRSKGKSPALLWHRFSLTPQPVFFHWPMAV